VGDKSARSVTRLIGGLKAGDAEAAAALWERYFARLVELAKQRLGRASRRVADEEDVAISVFDTLCRGAVAGRFTQLADRDDLWRLLIAITQQKAVDQIRRLTRDKRGGGAVRGDSVFIKLAADGDGSVQGFEAVLSADPTPELLASMDEEYQRLLALLRNDTLRQIAIWRMEGYSNEEIAGRLRCTTRSVERKLKLIREKWTETANAHKAASNCRTP
jgi:DNA-directed RNA polymerase specialized sigma24 family protein